MKKMIPTLIASLFIAGPTFAAKDLKLCNGQYLISAFKENQLHVSSLVLQGIANEVIHLKSYNPKVGPFAVFALEAATTDQDAHLLEMMQELALVPDLIIECNSTLIGQIQ